MSGDVQPRKRKEKRRKKDDLGVEEPRGTAATFGEGDVLMHSHHEHGTGGHWCAKIIFFSLLAVLVTLIGLIILENRGLSELEANAVESRYSGVLEGWIEDAPDDHHDEHTLELKHHRYEDNQDDGDNEELGELEHEDKVYHENDDTPDNSEHDDDTEHEIDEEQQDNEEDDDDEEHDNDEDYEDDNDSDDHEDDDITENGLEIDDQDEDVSNEQNVEEDNEDDETMEYNKYYKHSDDEDDDNFESNDSEEAENDNDSMENDEGYNDNKSNEIIEDNDDNNFSYENDIEDNTQNYYNKNFEQNEEDEEDLEEEIERIEKEFVDEVEEDTSGEASNIARNINNDKKDTAKDIAETQEIENEEIGSNLESDEVIEPTIMEQMTMPSGKPFVELEDAPSTEKPADTLAEEEEYEKRQEQIRLEKQESSSQMWMKLTVGGALLVATHAVIRRFTAPRDSPEAEDNTIHEDDPSLIDRRMTLIPKESVPLLPRDCFEQLQVEPVETVVKHVNTIQSDTTFKPEEERVNEHEELVRKEVTSPTKDVLDQELYSDDEEVDEEYEIEREVKEYSKDTEANVEKDADQSETEEVPDDVEIIDDEQIDEEIEEEDEDEEEISDVDDAELLSRLEAKYGRLPEPERPGYIHKDGGNNIEDEWPGEPSEQYWRQQLEFAEQEIRQGEWSAAGARLSVGELAGSARALWLAARALDAEAEQRRDNKLLTRAISAYLQLLKKNEQLSDKKLLQVTNRVLDRIQFRGNYLSAEPVYRILIRRFPNDVSYRNNLTVSFLMANRADLAGDVLKETLKLWPGDRVALAHYGFVLKTQYNKLEESVKFFHKALENDTGPACEPRFYYHLGDALLLLGRFDEAQEVHKRGAKNGHFLSPAQRSLYNVNRLKSRPWWRIEDTPYVKLARALETSWKDILKEGEAARALYEKEKEGLKEKGEWSQLDIFVRGQEIPGRCKRAPVTCSVVKSELAAAYCRRGQIKFSSMEPGTHVRPHVGPTNCRLRMHLGLSNTKDTYIRVDQETRQWQLGKVLLFDDSFEHEVWHNGTGTRLVLIVDVWHPDLTVAERRQLPAI